MADTIRFTRNYNDLSTDTGFQFEFFCDRCGSGYRSRFKTSATGLAASLTEAAGGLLGGVFGTAADIGRRAQSAAWEKAHDKAFSAAVDEITVEFAKCPHCSQWVCRESCWNTKRGLCKECGPDLGVEMSVAQAERSVEEIHTHAAMAEEDKKLAAEYWREGVRASCPECEAPLAVNARFCPNCGAKLTAEHCAKCGAKLLPKAKFCAECGKKTGE